MAKLKIFGDSISGNCLKVKWTADYLGLDYDWIETSVLKKETRTPEFLKLNPSGQVPAVILSDGRTLSQSNAIILYLAALNESALAPSDLYQRAKLDEWLFWEQYSHEPTIAVRRFQKAFLGKRDHEIDPALLKKGYDALARLEGTLAHSPYLVGSALTLADISLLAYTRMAGDGGYELNDFPAIREWIARVERDLSLPAYEGVH